MTIEVGSMIIKQNLTLNTKEQSLSILLLLCITHRKDTGISRKF